MTDIHDETTVSSQADAPAIESAEPAPEAANNGLPKRLRGTRDAQDQIPPKAAGRAQPARMESALEHATLCARIAHDNRAKNIQLLDLRGATPLVDFFVIASAASRRQASSIAYDIDAEMKKLNEQKLGMEGAEEGRWTLIDYGDFVVHIFSEEARTYYDLEQIWADAPKLDWSDPSRARPSPERRDDA